MKSIDVGSVISKDDLAELIRAAEAESVERRANACEIMADLACCTGSENYFSTMMKSIVFTDGVLLFAELAQAHWLIDLIASHQLAPDTIPDKDFQAWHVVRVGESAALALCGDGEDTGYRIMQEIPYTDLPMPSMEIWVENNGEQTVLLLPSEH